MSSRPGSSCKPWGYEALGRLVLRSILTPPGKQVVELLATIDENIVRGKKTGRAQG